MKTNQDYKNAALAALKGNWAQAVLATVIYMAVASSVGIWGEMADPQLFPAGVILLMTGSTLLVSILVLMPLEVGFYNTYKELLRKGDRAVTANMVKLAFATYGRNVLGMFLVGLYTLLWMLLFVIPGVIKAFSYAMTPFILADNPELSANQAIDLSRAMMKGRKFDLFWLVLSFMGWILLSILTLGVGLLWVIPYMYTAMASFYEDVKADYEQKAL